MPEVTHTQFHETGSPQDPVRLAGGGSLPGVRLAYESWGELNADKSNAILLFHALSGSHHAAGITTEIEGSGTYWQEELHAGWWEDMVGPGKALDTNKYLLRQHRTGLHQPRNRQAMGCQLSGDLRRGSGQCVLQPA
jgi:homoserine acetyltransferase